MWILWLKAFVSSILYGGYRLILEHGLCSGNVPLRMGYLSAKGA